MTSRLRVLAWMALLALALSSCDGDDARGPGETDAGEDASVHDASAKPRPPALGSFSPGPCQPFNVFFACCAWNCVIDDDPSTVACPSIPGLRVSAADDLHDWRECFDSSGVTDGVAFDLLTAIRSDSPAAACGMLSADACDGILSCVQGKGGLDALEAMGYPPPGRTTSCPVPPTGSADDAGAGDAGG